MSELEAADELLQLLLDLLLRLIRPLRKRLNESVGITLRLAQVLLLDLRKRLLEPWLDLAEVLLELRLRLLVDH
jgi:hypothetical protein